jgi:hypothetical protein
MATVSTMLQSTYRNSDWVDDDPERQAALAQWLDERCGCLTASRMKDAMNYLKNGSPSQKRMDYMRDLLAERLTGISTRHYVTPAMQWGLDTEAEAKLVYSRLTGHKLGPAEYVPHPTIPNCGATPDSILRDQPGLLEIKCPLTTTFVEWKMTGGVPEEHIAQMTLQAMCTQRPWVDFFAFDPRIKDEKLRHILIRFTPTADQIAKVEAEAIRFLDELDEMFNQFVMKS